MGWRAYTSEPTPKQGLNPNRLLWRPGHSGGLPKPSWHLPPPGHLLGQCLPYCSILTTLALPQSGCAGHSALGPPPAPPSHQPLREGAFVQFTKLTLYIALERALILPHSFLSKECGTEAHRSQEMLPGATAQRWKQPRRLLTGDWVKEMWCIQPVEYYSALKRKAILTHAMTWMNPEDMMLSEINQS